MHHSTILDADLAHAKSHDAENAVELQQEDEHHNALFNDCSLFSPISCPATCELCGQWLPKHTNSCPRAGIHPSQWDLASLKQLV
ncbi:hypothetical protein BC937DRAFT_91128 [Endogone sp. FLAS-F59071]|nr:hypothetical protein BC937DRAFT_91128 [Endogone sp. FLAS-F59071]|eukprot:RUS16512.1 hypothetical protein BC937DRAFT_91128 [Endogone sp. FLAS-F59071]